MKLEAVNSRLPSMEEFPAKDMMWALEYDPDLFLMYEDPDLTVKKAQRSKRKVMSIRQFGKYERENMRYGGEGAEAPLPISVFLVASVLKDKSAKLTEAKGLDEVVKILNSITGNLDAKKACSIVMKLQKKYLKKAANSNRWTSRDDYQGIEK